MYHQLFAWLATIILTWPIRGVGWVLMIYAFGYWVRKSKSLSARELFVRLLRILSRTWITMELLFIAWYLLSKRWVQARTSLPPFKGDRVKLLKGCFRSIEMIHEGLLLKKAEEKDTERVVATLEKESAFGCTVEGLLRRWNRGKNNEAPHIQALKQAMISVWFRCANPKDVYLENWLSFIAWTFFDSDIEDLCAAELSIINTFFEELHSCVTLPDVKAGLNPEVYPIRMGRDRVATKYRPLAFYSLYVVVYHTVNYVSLRYLGFEHHVTGSLPYWRYPGNSSKPPIVFCHGLAVGIPVYIPFIRGFMDNFPGRELFLIELDDILIGPLSMKAPSSAEIVVSIQEMLSAWGNGGNPPAAHFIGHSFGTFVVGWMIKYSVELVAAATFLAPCSFLLATGELVWKFYRKPTTVKDVILDYFVWNDSNISYFLRRNLLWHSCLLTAEELRRIPCLVILFGKDELTPSHSVLYYLTAAKKQYPLMPLEVVFYPESMHNDMLYDAQEQSKIFHELGRFGF